MAPREYNAVGWSKAYVVRKATPMLTGRVAAAINNNNSVCTRVSYDRKIISWQLAVSSQLPGALWTHAVTNSVDRSLSTA